MVCPGHVGRKLFLSLLHQEDVWNSSSTRVSPVLDKVVNKVKEFSYRDMGCPGCQTLTIRHHICHNLLRIQVKLTSYPGEFIYNAAATEFKQSSYYNDVPRSTNYIAQSVISARLTT